MDNNIVIPEEVRLKIADHKLGRALSGRSNSSGYSEALNIGARIALSYDNTEPIGKQEQEVKPSEDLIKQMDNVIGTYSTPMTLSTAKACAAIAQKHAKKKLNEFITWAAENDYEFNLFTNMWEDAELNEHTTNEIYSLFLTSNS